MLYKVKFPSASIEKKFRKDLDVISPVGLQDKIMEEILNLAKNPRPKGEPKIKPPIVVYSHTAQYRLRIGNYRVLYDVDDKRRIIWVFAVRKRNEKTYD